MPVLDVSDIDTFIANDRSAIRYYLRFSLCVFIVGLLVFGLTFVPAFEATDQLHDAALKAGGAFIAVLSGFPLKEWLARKDRLVILTALRERIASLRSQPTPAEDDLLRTSALVWDIYRKGARG